MAKQARAAGGLSTPAGSPATPPQAPSTPSTPWTEPTVTGEDPAPARTEFTTQLITIALGFLGGPDPDLYQTKAIVHSSGLAIHAIAFSEAETLGENFWGCISHVKSGRSVVVVSPMQARASIEILASTGAPWADDYEAVEEWARSRPWMGLVVQVLREGDLGRARRFVEKHRAAEEGQ